MFALHAPENIPEDLKLLYEDTVQAASIAHAMLGRLADSSSTVGLESLPPNVDRLSQAVQDSRDGLRRLEHELNPVSGCRTQSNFHMEAVMQADRILTAVNRPLMARAGLESEGPTDPAEVRRYFQGVSSFDLFSLIGAMRQEICDAASARDSKAAGRAVPRLARPTGATMSPERRDLNYLRLFDGVIGLFGAVQQDGSIEPQNTAFLLKAFDELMNALGIDRSRTWQDNYQRLGSIERTGKSLQRMAEGALEFFEPTNRKGWGLGVIEDALVGLWEQLDESEKIVLYARYQHAISIYKQLPPVLALWDKENVPRRRVRGQRGKELTKEEMQLMLVKIRARGLRDTWEIDACFSKWAEREFGPQSAANNGPVPPNLVWVKGIRHELPPRLWSLVNYMWDRDKAPVQDVTKHVWEDEGLEVADGTIRSTLSQLNSRLTDIGLPWTLCLRRGYLVKNS